MCMDVHMNVEKQLVEDDLDADGLIGHFVSIHGKPVPKDSKTPPDKVHCSDQSYWSDDPRNSEWYGVSGESYGSSEQYDDEEPYDSEQEADEEDDPGQESD